MLDTSSFEVSHLILSDRIQQVCDRRYGFSEMHDTFVED